MVFLSFYQQCFAACLVLTAVFFFLSQRGSKAATFPSGFKSFQQSYLLAYGMAMAGDWLQGPYVYALYASYNYDKAEIAALFVAGFGSSMLFGTVVGSLADKLGRKKMALLYCLIYIASCCTKHFQNYWILMLGRLLGGVATSLVYSVFDSWLCSEHASRGFDPSLLSDTFSKAMVVNSCVAILSGVVAEWGASLAQLTTLNESFGFHYGGYTAPFDMASLCLGVCFMLITAQWQENFGEEEKGGDSGLSLSALKKGLEVIKGNENVLLIGLTCSLFEGSMFTFVFMWTPVMTKLDTPELPFGLIFATFMLCCMMGSAMFNMGSKKMEIPSIGKCMLGVAAVALCIPAGVRSAVMVFLAFLVFEICVGIYWPCMGTLKGIHVPDEQRSAIYNIFRVPLNIIVVFILLVEMEIQTTFVCIVLMLSCAYALQNRLAARLALNLTGTTLFATPEKATAKMADLEAGTQEVGEDDASA